MTPNSVSRSLAHTSRQTKSLQTRAGPGVVLLKASLLISTNLDRPACQFLLRPRGLSAGGGILKLNGVAHVCYRMTAHVVLSFLRRQPVSRYFPRKNSS